MDAALRAQRDTQHRAEEERCNSRRDLASNSVSDDKIKSALHLQHGHRRDLLHSTSGATAVLSLAEKRLKKSITSPSSHRRMNRLYSLDLFSAQITIYLF